MTPDKIASMLGFAMRAGKAVYGVDMICRSGSKVYAVLYAADLAEGSAFKLKAAAAAKGAAVIRCADDLSEITHRVNCKAIGVADRQMAEAILGNLNEKFVIEPAEVK